MTGRSIGSGVMASGDKPMLVVHQVRKPDVHSAAHVASAAVVRSFRTRRAHLSASHTPPPATHSLRT
jgi:hypothetical protein